jgi:hypothetical protein
VHPRSIVRTFSSRERLRDSRIQRNLTPGRHALFLTKSRVAATTPLLEEEAFSAATCRF